MTDTNVVVRATAVPGRPDLPLYDPYTAGVHGVGGAGIDLLAAERWVLEPGRGAHVGTGLAFTFPAGYEGQLRHTETSAFRQGVAPAHEVSTLETSDHEVKILMINTSRKKTRVIEIGDRIARLVVAPRQVKLELDAYL